MATTYLDMLPIEIMDIILDKIHRAELKEHKHKSKQLIAYLTHANHEKVYCSGCGKNIMGRGEAMTFYKNDMKTYINIGERCCMHNADIIKCSRDESTFKDYDLCYESLEKEDRERDGDERCYIKIIDENKYNLGYGAFF